MNNEKYAVYERNLAHGSTKNGMILGPFNSKEEAQSNGEKYGYTGDNYYVNSVNKEKMNQIIDEAYGNYSKTPVDYITFSERNKHFKSDGLEFNSGYPNYIHFTQEEFINKCKTDSEFSEKWGLKIEERELSRKERSDYYYKNGNKEGIVEGSLDRPIWEDNEFAHKWYDERNVPTKLITITYNNETIESYEQSR